MVSNDAAWPVDGGETGALIRAHDWAGTPLGPIEGWPRSLRTAVDICLAAAEPTAVLWGPHFIQLYNDAYARAAPVAHPAMLGRPALDNWPDAGDPLAPALARVVADGRPLTAADRPVAVVGPDGPEGRFFTFTFAAIRDEAGAVGGILHRAVETTGRVRAEAALRASEERLRLARDVTRLAVFAWDLATDRVEADARVRDLFGFGPDEAVRGADILARGVHPESRAAVAGWLRAAADPDSDGRFMGEFRAATPDDAERWVLANGQVYFTGAGAARRPVRIVGTGLDITARKQSERALAASEARFRGFAEASSDALWIVEAATGRLVYLSPAFDAMFGAPRAAVLRDPAAWAALVHPDDRAVSQTLLPRALAGEPAAGSYRIVRPADGATRWLRDAGFPIRDDAGTVVAVGGIVRDVTEQRRAAADRERLYQAEREARALAEAMVRGRDEFLATAAHELRHPLARLRLSTQLLALGDALPAAERPETLASIGRAADRLETLVRDLVDLARLRTGQLTLSPRPTDPARLVREAVAELGERHGPPHRFRAIVRRALPAARLDPVRIWQVLANLLDNAVAYSPRGADVTVTARAEGDGVAVAVRDRGQGLPPGEADAIFAPFARSAATVAGQQPGLGLGLAICRGIVEGHGGRIAAESAGPGKGMTVTFWLPLAGPPGTDRAE